jgi:hypothetical protein
MTPKPDWSEHHKDDPSPKDKSPVVPFHPLPATPPASEDERYNEALSNFNASVCLSKDLPTLDIPARLLLMGQWMREGDLGFIYGDRGSGKTWLVYALAIYLSSGRDLAGWTVTEPVSVLLVDGEMPPDDTKSRITGLGGLNERLLLLHHEVLFARTGAAMNLGNPDQQRAITELCIKRSAKVLILDNLSCLVFGVGESDADEWEKMKLWLLDLRRRRIAVIIVHHSGVSGRMRGTTKRENDAFWIIRVENLESHNPDDAEGAYFETTFQKRRNDQRASLPRKWKFKTEPDGTVSIGHEELTFDAKVFDLFKVGLSSGEIAEELHVVKSTVPKAAARLEKLKLLEKSGRGWKARGLL